MPQIFMVSPTVYIIIILEKRRFVFFMFELDFVRVALSGSSEFGNLNKK